MDEKYVVKKACGSNNFIFLIFDFLELYSSCSVMACDDVLGISSALPVVLRCAKWADTFD